MSAAAQVALRGPLSSKFDCHFVGCDDQNKTPFPFEKLIIIICYSFYFHSGAGSMGVPRIRNVCYFQW